MVSLSQKIISDLENNEIKQWNNNLSIPYRLHKNRRPPGEWNRLAKPKTDGRAFSDHCTQYKHAH